MNKPKLFSVLLLLALCMGCERKPVLHTNAAMQEELEANRGMGGGTITPYVPPACSEHREAWYISGGKHYRFCAACGEKLSEEEPHEAERTELTGVLILRGHLCALREFRCRCGALFSCELIPFSPDGTLGS